MDFNYKAVPSFNQFIEMPVLSESEVSFSVLHYSFTVFFFLVICPLPEKALSHAVTVSGFQKSVWEFVETSVIAWTLTPFFPLFPPQHYSVLPF